LTFLHQTANLTGLLQGLNVGKKKKTIPCKTLASAVAAELSHRPWLKMKENGNYKM
jgi:hypothetical protein